MSLRLKATKYKYNPILIPIIEEGSFERAAVYNPAAIVREGKVYLIYRGEEDYYEQYISRLGLAISDDGFKFERYEKNPILEEDLANIDEKRGCEDPRIVLVDDSKFFLTYVAFDGGQNIKLCGAFSSDLKRFEKIGKIIPGKEKSGAIVQNYKYKGEYVMYFGDDSIKVAYSRDLKKWSIKKNPVLSPRKDFFDSYLVEGGPPPILVDEGILMIYNSAKEHQKYDGKTSWLSYSPGFAIFDKNDPTKLIYRSPKPLLKPSKYWEKYGKVNYVIFATGLVKFLDKWLLYYGGADKSIGVAQLTFKNSFVLGTDSSPQLAKPMLSNEPG